MCKVCYSDHRELIEEMARGKVSIPNILKEMKARGVNLGRIALVNHLNKHTDILLESYQKGSQVTRSISEDELFSIVDSIDIPAIHKSLGISDDLQDGYQVAESIQKYTASIFLKLSAIVSAQLDRYATNPDNIPFPKNEITAWEKAITLTDLGWGISEMVKLKAAVETLSRQGYEIKNPTEIHTIQDQTHGTD